MPPPPPAQIQIVEYKTDIMYNWRIASVYDVESNMDKIQELLADKEWHICSLADGTVKGPGYGYEISREPEAMGHKIIIA